MTKSKMANRYSPEVRARAVRMVFEHQGSYETQAGAYSGVIRPVFPKVSGHPFRFYPATDSGASGHPVM